MQTWKAEMQKTLNAVNALTKDMCKLNYRYDEKSRSAAELIEYILPHAEAI